jgi:hypothetical protein
MPPPTQEPQQQQQGGFDPAATGGAFMQAAGSTQQPLNQTGLQAQLATVNQQNQQTAQATLGPPLALTPGAAPQAPAAPDAGTGSNNVQQLAQRLAQGYGLAVGKDNIVDEQGNFLMTPDQMAASSGMAPADAAASMQYLSQAISRQQNEQQQALGVAALQTGLGQVQSNARGSLAAMQSGFYQGLADMYSNKEYASADFSYFIQRDKEAAATALNKAQQKQAEKTDVWGAVIGGAAAGGAIGGPIGAGIGAVAGWVSSWF